MSAVEREKAVVKKREAPGSLNGCRVSETRKEKKRRRLILMDSESDDDNFVVSHRDEAPAADSKVKSEAVVDLGSEHGTRCVEVGETAEAFVGSEVFQNGVGSADKETSGIDGLSMNKGIMAGNEGVLIAEVAKSVHSAEVKVESDRGLSSERGEEKGEDDSKKIKTMASIKRKGSIDHLAGVESLKVEAEAIPKMEAVQGQLAAERTKGDVLGVSLNVSGRISTVKRTSSLDPLNCKEETKVDVKKGLLSKVVAERDEVYISQPGQNEKGSVTRRKAIKEQLFSKEELKVDAKKALKSTVVKEREDAGGTKKLISKEEVKLEAQKALKSAAVKKREDAGGTTKCLSFLKVDGKNGADSSNRNKDRSDSLGRKVDKKVELRKVTNLKAVKAKERADSVGKEYANSGSEKKRSRQMLDDEIRLKKLKSESMKHIQERKTGACVKSAEARIGDKGFAVRANVGSKLVASSSRQQDNLKEKNDQESGSEKCIEHSTTGTARMLKNKTSSGGMRRDEADMPQQKAMRMPAGSGVLRVLPSNKKVGGIDGVHIQREERENRKRMTHHQLLSKESKVEKPVKNKLKVVKVSAGESARPSRGSMEGEASHQTKSRRTDVSHHTTECIIKRETQSKTKASVMAELNADNKAGERRSTIKQRVREQIKEILLDAGWKIDLRPRRGRTYEDAVYVPPGGGSGFWSVTKAYAVYLEHCKEGDQGHEKNSTTFATIPAELLKLLTRNVVNKRRSGKEIEKSKKLGVRKKEKGSKKTISTKEKGRKVSGKDGIRVGKVQKKRKTDGNFVDSTHLRGRKEKQRGCTLVVRGANQDTDTDDDDDYVPYIWKRTILSWMIDLGVLHIDGKVKYKNRNKRQTQTLLEGSITRDGIRCDCCTKIISISKFESHSGSKVHQPYQNIFVEEAGISLLQCQLNAWQQHQESEQWGFYRVNIEGDDPNDDTCGICGDGGDLICCDGCPSAFHLNCLGIQMLPPGDWHCTYCSCRYCGSVTGPVAEESGSDPSVLLTCSQCEKKYHKKCIPEADNLNDSGTPFCCKSCMKVFKKLQKLIGTKNDLGAGLSWSVIRCFDEDSSDRPYSVPKRAECNSKIAVAFAVMDECFRPIVDYRSGINLIHNVVYNCGSNINRLSYTGFYTFVLERGDEIIAVASVRIHGTKLAEMPFIGTRNMYRRQGMCRQLLRGIESALSSLNVEQLIIPAISELTETWTGVFGFRPLGFSQRQQVRSINLLVFPGTGLLHKPILEKDQSEEHTTSEEGEMGRPVTELLNLSKPMNNCSSPPRGLATNHGSGEEVALIGREMHRTDLVLQIAETPTSEIQTLPLQSSRTVADADLSVQLNVDQPTNLGSGEEVALIEHKVHEADLVLQITEKLDAPPGFEVQILPFQSSRTSADMDLSVQLNVDQPTNRGSGEEVLHIEHEVHEADLVLQNTEKSDSPASLPIHSPRMVADADLSVQLNVQQPTNCGSVEEVAHSKHEVHEADIVLQTAEKAVTPPVSEIHTHPFQSSMTIADTGLSVPLNVDQSEHTHETTLNTSSPDGPKIEKHFKRENDKVENAASNYGIDDTSGGQAVSKDQHLIVAENGSSASAVKPGCCGAGKAAAHPEYDRC